MKKLIILLNLLMITIFGIAQKVEVVSLDQKIEKLPRTGIAIYLELDKNDVENLWKKQLKEYGKLEKESGNYFINGASVKAVTSSSVRVLSIVESTSQGTMVWLALDKGDTYIKKGDSGYEEMKKLLYDFGVMAYRNDVMKQIEEAEKAHAKALKNQEKTVKDGERLANSLTRNGENKVRLEQELVKNGEEKVQLEQDIKQNIADQKKAAEEFETMQKLLDDVRKKLHDIH